jgi:DNA-binding phage protein
MNVQEYLREDGSNPYQQWFDSLDAKTAAKVTVAKSRLELGNTSSVKAKEEVKIMVLTRDFKETVNARVQRDPEFAIALLDEAASLFLNGEPETARLILRDLVNATVGFEELAIETSKPSKSLHRMLSAKGNPTMDNLTTIFNVLRKELRVDIKVEVSPQNCAMQ